MKKNPTPKHGDIVEVHYEDYDLFDTIRYKGVRKYPFSMPEWAHVTKVDVLYLAGSREAKEFEPSLKP